MNSVIQTVSIVNSIIMMMTLGDTIRKRNNFRFSFLILEKIKKRYGHLPGKIVRIKITRTNSSLGIALAGHKNRNEMGCFIAGINPKGSMCSQDFKVGDEILEVLIYISPVFFTNTLCKITLNSYCRSSYAFYPLLFH